MAWLALVTMAWAKFVSELTARHGDSGSRDAGKGRFDRRPGRIELRPRVLDFMREISEGLGIRRLEHPYPKAELLFQDGTDDAFLPVHGGEERRFAGIGGTLDALSHAARAPKTPPCAGSRQVSRSTGA
jgi:hypothetical protein